MYENNEMMDYDWDNDPIINELIEFCRNRPNPETQVLVPERYLDMVRAKKLLDELFVRDMEDAESEIELNLKWSHGVVRAEVISLQVNDPELLGKAIAYASIVDFCPTSTGKLMITMTFHDVLIPVTYQNP